MSWAQFGVETTYSTCATVDKVYTQEAGRFKRDHCQTKTCPVCLIKDWPSVMKIRGLCDKLNVDTFYYLINDTHLLGHSRSKIEFHNGKWKIVDRKGSTKGWIESDSLPLGLKEWNVECDQKLLNLQEAVDQPGHFCCDDGACVKSELVCDSRKAIK